MVEFRVVANTNEVVVLRAPNGLVTLNVPENILWVDIHSKVSADLNSEELALAEKIWCDDEFPRKFGLGDGFVTIRAYI